MQKGFLQKILHTRHNIAMLKNQQLGSFFRHKFQFLFSLSNKYCQTTLLKSCLHLAKFKSKSDKSEIMIVLLEEKEFFFRRKFHVHGRKLQDYDDMRGGPKFLQVMASFCHPTMQFRESTFFFSLAAVSVYFCERNTPNGVRKSTN